MSEPFGCATLCDECGTYQNTGTRFETADAAICTDCLVTSVGDDEAVNSSAIDYARELESDLKRSVGAVNELEDELESEKVKVEALTEKLKSIQAAAA